MWCLDKDSFSPLPWILTTILRRAQPRYDYFPLFWWMKGQRKASNLDSLDTVLGSSMTLGCLHLEEDTFPLLCLPFLPLIFLLQSFKFLRTKACIVKAMVFPVVMYGCESWTIKKAEHQRIDAFKLWCWRRPLRVSWTARRSNQSILKEINPEYSLEGLMLKLNLQYFGYLMQRVNSLEKTLMLGKIEGRRRRGWQDEMVGWYHWLNGHEFEPIPGDGEEQGSLVCYSPQGHRAGHDWVTEQWNWGQGCPLSPRRSDANTI